MDINTIEQKIRALEGGQFQKLCSALFTKKYPNYVMQPNGGSIGSNKTTKGHPDFLLKNENSTKFILVECTTKAENLEEKIKSDLGCCVNEKITGIKNDEIEQIVFCYTGREINNSVYSEIANDLKKLNIVFNAYGIGAIASEIYNKYQVLAADFLGISVPFSKCVFELDEFVKESEENGLSPSLDKKFGYRDRELEIIRDAIKERHFVLLSGNAGVGKTKLALEFARGEVKTNARWVVLKASGNPNIEEVRETSSTCSNFIIDDLSSFGESIPVILQILKKHNVIATSRDYLTADLEVVLKNQNIAYKSVVVNPLDSKSIEEIIKNNTEIKDVRRLNKIIDVAKGNARIAFMMADETEKKGTISPLNTKDVFANYYYDRIASIKKWAKRSEELLRLIGLVCLLKKFSIESIKDDDPLLELVGIPKKELQESLDFLNVNDIVCLFYNDVVTVSDQCLADYLAYYVFLEKKSLKLSLVINAYFESSSDKIVDMLNMFGMVFNTEERIDYISDEIKESWDFFVKKGNLNVLKLFCAKFALLNENNTLSFLYKHANEPNDILSGVINGNLDWRLSAISSLLNSKTKPCCQIIEEMILSKSIDVQSITDILIQKHGITISSIRLRLKSQMALLSFFIEKKQELSLNFLKQYCLSMLKFVIQYTEVDKNKFGLYSFKLNDEDTEVMKLRALCFDVIFECNDAYDSLEVYFSDTPQKGSIGLLKKELSVIAQKLIALPSRSKIRELIIYLKAKSILNFYGLRWEFMENCLQELLDLISPVLPRINGIEGKTVDEKEAFINEYINKGVNNSSFEVNFNRLELFNRILEYADSLPSDACKFIEIWFSCLTGKIVNEHFDDFIALSNIVKKTNYYNCFIVDRLSEDIAIDEAYKKIISCKNTIFKEKVILYFFKKAFEMNYSAANDLFDFYLADIENALPSEETINMILHINVPIEKKYSFLKKLYALGNYSQRGDYSSLFYLLDGKKNKPFDYLLNTDVKFVEKLYLLSLQNSNSYFDYHGECLGLIIKKDNSFCTDVIKFLLKRDRPFEYVRRIQIVWKLENYMPIANVMFEFICSNMNPSFFYDGTIMFGFYAAEGPIELSSEQLIWLSSYLRAHTDRKSIMNLNALVRELGQETAKCYAKWLIDIKASKDLFADFLQPEPFASYSGSYKSVIDLRIAFYKQILNMIPEDIVFIEHKKLVEERIKRLRNEIEPTLKYEMINDF